MSLLLGMILASVVSAAGLPATRSMAGGRIAGGLDNDEIKNLVALCGF